MAGLGEGFRGAMETVWAFYLWTITDPVVWLTVLAVALAWGVICWLLEGRS